MHNDDISHDNGLEQLRAEVKALREAVASYRATRVDDAKNEVPSKAESTISASAEETSESPITFTEFPHVIRVKGKHGGSPLMKESYISVKTIAAFTKMGYSPAKFVAEYVGQINIAEVHEALAYYYRHIDEIEDALRADEQATLELKELARRRFGEKAL